MVYVALQKIHRMHSSSHIRYYVFRARPPREPPAILSGTPELGRPHSAVPWLVFVRLIIFKPILTIKTFRLVPFLMEYIDKSIVHLFYKVLIILEIVVNLIICSSSKATSKVAENNGLIVVKSARVQYPGLSGVWAVGMMATIANTSYGMYLGILYSTDRTTTFPLSTTNTRTG